MVEKFKSFKRWLCAGAVMLSASLAQAAGNFAATDSITTQMKNLQQDVSQEITPIAIGVVVAVALLIAGRGLIKKFFKI